MKIRYLGSQVKANSIAQSKGEALLDGVKKGDTPQFMFYAEPESADQSELSSSVAKPHLIDLSSQRGEDEFDFLELKADESVTDLGFTGTIQLDRSIRISDVNGWSEREGVKEGDTLLQLNGKFVTDLETEEVYRALGARPVEVVTVRNMA